MTVKVYDIQDKIEKGKPVAVQFNSRVTGHRSGETYLISGIVNNSNVLVKRMSDPVNGGVMCSIDELTEVN